jgi:hypothetical protein
MLDGLISQLACFLLLQESTFGRFACEVLKSSHGQKLAHVFPQKARDDVTLIAIEISRNCRSL